MGIGDIDNDGKSDIVVTNLSSNTLSIFRNNSFPGQISFDSKVDLPTGRTPRNILVTDLDGDHFPDILFVNSESGTLSIIKNNSTPGIISLLPKGDYPTNSYPESLSVGNLNNDNK